MAFCLIATSCVSTSYTQYVPLTFAMRRRRANFRTLRAVEIFVLVPIFSSNAALSAANSFECINHLLKE